MFDSFLKYQALVEQQFKRLQATYGFTIVDAHQSVDAVNAILRQEIQTLLTR